MTSLTAGARIALLLAAMLAACERDASPSAPQAAMIERGANALRSHGCGACHRIPGIAGAHGNVGPSLAGIQHRAYLAGVLPNSPDNMARWIREPQRISAATAMPDMQVSASDADAITAYLYNARGAR